jgi:1-acyl-sn-glycerol-3-phosphate acyltransferase
MSDSHRDLPPTHDVGPLGDRVLRTARPVASWLLRRWYDVHIHRDDLVPRTGPVLLAPNHVGYLDGPLLVATAPRPVHAMVKREMFTGAFKRVLSAGGQIPLDRFNVDPYAVKLAVRVLRDDKVLAIYPEGSRGAGDGRFVKPGWAYLAMVTGAPVVPVAVFGSRLPGTSLPPRGQRVDLVYGEPVSVPPRSWPRRSRDVLALTEDLQKQFREHIEQAGRRYNGVLPGAAPDAEGPEPGSISADDTVTGGLRADGTAEGSRADPAAAGDPRADGTVTGDPRADGTVTGESP